jgi:hypothetical protein
MMIMGYKIRRTDANQVEIVKRARQLGVKVLILSEVGKGCPDTLWLLPKVEKNPFKLVLVEIKDGSKIPSARKLTVDEQKFHDEWGDSVIIISSIKEVEDLVSKHFLG